MSIIDRMPGILFKDTRPPGKFRQEQKHCTDPGPVKVYTKEEISRMHKEVFGNPEGIMHNEFSREDKELLSKFGQDRVTIVKNYIDLGRWLTEKKIEIKKEGYSWVKWLKKHVTLSVRSCQYAMKLHTLNIPEEQYSLGLERLRTMTNKKYKPDTKKNKRNTPDVIAIKHNILDAIATSPSDIPLTIPVITHEVAKLMDIPNDHKINSAVYRIFGIFEANNGMRKTKTFVKRSAIWIKTKDFFEVENQIRTTFSNQNPYGVGSVKFDILRLIYKYPNPSFTLKELIGWSGFDDSISIATLKDYVYTLLVEERYLIRLANQKNDGRTLTYEKSKKLLNEFREDDEDEDIPDPVIPAGVIPDEDLPDIREAREMSMEDKLKYFDLTPEDIGSTIVDLITSLQKTVSESVCNKSEITSLIDEVSSSNKRVVEYQTKHNEMKRTVDSLKKELKSARESLSARATEIYELKQTNTKEVRRLFQELAHTKSLLEKLKMNKKQKKTLRTNLGDLKSKINDLRL